MLQMKIASKMIEILKKNWKVYSMEAICLGIFMIAASVCSSILEAPASPVRLAIPNSQIRLIIMGLSMGVTATLIIYSPMGKLSGAHMNPAISLVFFRLGKLRSMDTFFYIVFQLAGGTLAVSAMAALLGDMFQRIPVNYIITIPGNQGPVVALLTEATMAFGMMLMVLLISNHPRFSRFTGVIAGILVSVFLIVSADISGFSINPARTLASAIPAWQFPSVWIYLTAPLIGMFAAAELYNLFQAKVNCGKLHHSASYTCIFNCGYCKHTNKSAAN
jgi:aquaporin Z